jgi:hypothetical protein
VQYSRPPSTTTTTSAPGVAPYPTPAPSSTLSGTSDVDIEANAQAPNESLRAKYDRKMREAKQIYKEAPQIRKIAMLLAMVSASCFALGLLLIIIPFIGWAWTILLWMLALVFIIAGAFCWVAPEAYKSMVSTEKRSQLEMVLLTNEAT